VSDVGKIRIECPFCQAAVLVKPEWAGRRVRCPGEDCGRLILVPHARPAGSRGKREPEPEEPPGCRTAAGRARALPLGWLGFLLISGWAALVLLRLAIRGRFSDWVAVPMGIGMLLAALGGLTLSLLGAILRRGEVGGALGVVLGIILALLMCVLSR
jgi:hypothetical protein